MLKTFTTYFVLLVFCAQAAIAGVDVHAVHNEKVDIVHHYLDDHSNNCDSEWDKKWDEASANISLSDNLETSQTSHSDASHHGCSGHVTPMAFMHLSYLKPLGVPAKASFNYLASFYSLTPTPSIRPPIFS